VITAFKIVEQTTRGITVAEERRLQTPVVNVARSKSKAAEGQFIGEAVAAKVLQGLKRLGADLSGKKVTLVGYGLVGECLARALRDLGCQVTVVETSSGRSAAARKAGFVVQDKAAALAGAEIVIGATGMRSITLDDLKLLRPGAVVASASSKQVEIDMVGLRAAARSRQAIASDSPLVLLPNYSYRLGMSTITVLGDGWPVNFDGDVESVPNESIQLTRALMFAGALQAASYKGHVLKNHGILEFDKQVDQQILSRFRKLMHNRTMPAPFNPDHWASTIRGIAAVVDEVRRR
jgi:S-adenosylhomocysteine hydrolase